MQAEAGALLDCTEAAALLGRSTKTVRRWDAAGVLPRPVLIRGKRYFRRRDLDLWLEWQCPAWAVFEGRLKMLDARSRRRAG